MNKTRIPAILAAALFIALVSTTTANAAERKLVVAPAQAPATPVVDATTVPQPITLAFAQIEKGFGSYGPPEIRYNTKIGAMTCPREATSAAVSKIMVGTDHPFIWGALGRTNWAIKFMQAQALRGDAWIATIDTNGNVLLYLGSPEETGDAAKAFGRPIKDGGVVLNTDLCKSGDEDCKLGDALRQVALLPDVKSVNFCARTETEKKPSVHATSAVFP